MPKAIKKKISKKETATADVSERLTELKESLREKQKMYMSYGLAALAVVAVVIGIFVYRYSTGEKAKQLEYEGYKMYYNMYSKTPAAAQDRYQKSLELFKQAYAIRKSPRVLLYIADVYSELGRYDEATTTINDFFKKYSSDKNLAPLAYEKLAGIQLKKGNKQEALKTLETLYNLPGGIYKDAALFESAGILEADGKKDEANAKYREITEKFKNSPYYEEAKAKITATTAAEKKEG